MGVTTETTNPNYPNSPSDAGTFAGGQVSSLTQDFYQYSLYEEYLKNINYYLLNSKKNSIVIKFFHNNVGINLNYNDETRIHNIEKFQETVYDIYEFCPTMDNQAINYTIGRNDARLGRDINGMSTLTLFQMVDPLPDDLFSFYSEPDEIFRVIDVVYIQSVHSKLKLYQITYENAPIVKKSVDALEINETYYFNNEFDNWFPSKYYSNFVGLIQNKPNLIKTIKTYYDRSACYFKPTNILDISPVQLEIMNRTIHALKILAKVDLPVLLRYKHVLNQYGYPVTITLDETYVIDPDAAPIDVNAPGYVYSPYEGKIQHPLLYSVFNLYQLYKPFIEISLGKEVV